MQKLTNQDLQAAMSYILREPEFNLFLIGDIEIYGLESEHVSAYTADSWDGEGFPYFILNYRGNFLVYSHDLHYDYEKVARFLSDSKMRNLSGKLELIAPLIPYLKGLEIVPTYLSRLNAISDTSGSAFYAHRLKDKDVPDIYAMLSQIDEFYSIKSKTKEENLADILESITHGGRMYGIFDGDNLVSLAGTAAENSISAMVVSVATLPEYRKMGYATELVSRLCKDCLDEGMRFLCLFYDNPHAGAIYRRLGFVELGQYAMVKSMD